MLPILRCPPCNILRIRLKAGQHELLQQADTVEITEHSRQRTKQIALFNSSWPAEILARRRLLTSRRHSACSISMAMVSKKCSVKSGTIVPSCKRLLWAGLGWAGFVRLTIFRYTRARHATEKRSSQSRCVWFADGIDACYLEVTFCRRRCWRPIFLDRGSSLDMPFGGVVERSQEYGKSSTEPDMSFNLVVDRPSCPIKWSTRTGWCPRVFCTASSGLKNEAVRHQDE